MKLNEFKDAVFEILNETDTLPVYDIECYDLQNQMKVTLQDGSQFFLSIDKYATRLSDEEPMGRMDMDDMFSGEDEDEAFV